MDEWNKWLRLFWALNNGSLKVFLIKSFCYFFTVNKISKIAFNHNKIPKRLKNKAIMVHTTPLIVNLQ